MTLRAIQFVAALLLCACSTVERAPQARDSIGSATMSEDGVITLMLRAEGPNGEIGDALFRHAPGSPDYQSVIEHLGGIAPGENKPVPPWKD